MVRPKHLSGLQEAFCTQGEEAARDPPSAALARVQGALARRFACNLAGLAVGTRPELATCTGGARTKAKLLGQHS